MSFSRNCRGKRRSDAVDYHYRDHNANCGSGVSADVGALPLKRKRLSFSTSGWECGPGDRYAIPSAVGRSWIGDNGLVHFNSSWAFPGQLLTAPLLQRGVNSSDIMRVKKPEPVTLAEEEDPVFMSRDEIDRCSPSRKDGIDAIRETRLRYSYCSFLQNLGLKLELPQTTIGTAMVLCHRFFVRRSHACHDRFLIATAALFLATKSEETPCLLNNVLTAACEICRNQNLSFLPQFLPVDWFEQYREQVIGAENMILTTLNFELNVQHPYTSLTSVLKKLGLSQSALVNLAWSLISEGLRSSLWLQFKPHHIAAGAAFLAARFLNFDLAFYPNILREFETTPPILQEVVQQLMELLLCEKCK